jgi:RsiW-degrading membrane proteinase PrsW (M82 family)
MFNSLLFISLAPVIVIAFYIYTRDIYEKEPVNLLLKALLIGVLIALPVVLIEYMLDAFYLGSEGLSQAAYTAFIVAALTEEGIKFLAMFLFFWKERNFNEKFDGIVYAVYISLGFAGIENVLYVFMGGYSIGILRALTAVPAHAFFGIMMGYYFGLARFDQKSTIRCLILAFVVPFISHGLYDFLLMGNTPLLLVIFIPVFLYFWVSGFRKMSKLSDLSVFKKEIVSDQDYEETIDL